MLCEYHSMKVTYACINSTSAFKTRFSVCKYQVYACSTSRFKTSLILYENQFFSNKSIEQARKIILLEKNEIVSDDREILEIFKNYFSTITESIDIPKYDTIDKEYLSITDPVLRAAGKYKDYPNIARINSLTKNNTKFNFKHFCPWEIKEKVPSLKSKSSSLQMSVSILKNSIDVCLISLTDQLNRIVKDCH